MAQPLGDLLGRRAREPDVNPGVEGRQLPRRRRRQGPEPVTDPRALGGRLVREPGPGDVAGRGIPTGITVMCAAGSVSAIPTATASATAWVLPNMLS